MAVLRIESGILGAQERGLLFSFRCLPVYGGFAYLVAPRLVLGVNVLLLRNAPRGVTERFGQAKWPDYD